MSNNQVSLYKSVKIVVIAAAMFIVAGMVIATSMGYQDFIGAVSRQDSAATSTAVESFRSVPDGQRLQTAVAPASPLNRYDPQQAATAILTTSPLQSAKREFDTFDVAYKRGGLQEAEAEEPLFGAQAFLPEEELRTRAQQGEKDGKEKMR